MKKAVFIAVCLVLLAGCTTTEKLAESVKSKNIVAGTDAYGASITIGLDPTTFIPTFDIWAGRFKAWYISFLSGVEIIPEIIEAQNTEVGAEISASNVNLGAK